MHLILTLCLALGAVEAWSAPTITLSPGSIGVRKGPGDGYLQLFFLTKGEKVAVMEAEGDYSKIRVKRGGKIYGGYVLSAQLFSKVEVLEIADEGWALGFGMLVSDLSQKGKSFQTEDQVTYTTSRYSSAMVSPLFWVQVSRRNFWRFFLGSRMTHFTGSAKTDVVGAVPQSVVVEHRMYTFGVQKVWNPIRKFQPFYYGVGGEAARATSLTIKMDGVELPTAAEDLPLYIGVHAVAGLQSVHSGHWSSTLELRVGQFVNQSVFALEAGGAVFYWF